MDMVSLMRLTVEKDASDLHITVGEPPMLRIHGELLPQGDHRFTAEEAEKLILSILTEKQKRQFEETMELDMSFSLPHVSRFRVNVYRRSDGIGAALRVIPSTIPTMRGLGLPPVASNMIKHKDGLVLVTGPTGSGKSTTLAAMIDGINNERRCHIMTIEDPIEFVYEHKKAMVNQRELNAHTLSFPNALKHLVRQDPDVVLVGEMRDLETISSTITIAETGHLVFATLHTLDAAQTVNRIVDVFPAYQQQQIRTQLTACLRGVVAQQLLLRKDGKGRVAAREIMIVTSAIQAMIREGKMHQIYGAIQTGASEGMRTMETSVAELYSRGLITSEVAMSSVNDVDALLTTIRSMPRVQEKEPAKAAQRGRSAGGEGKGDRSWWR